MGNSKSKKSTISNSADKRTCTDEQACQKILAFEYTLVQKIIENPWAPWEWSELHNDLRDKDLAKLFVLFPQKPWNYMEIPTNVIIKLMRQFPNHTWNLKAMCQTCSIWSLKKIVLNCIFLPWDWNLINARLAPQNVLRFEKSRQRFLKNSVKNKNF